MVRSAAKNHAHVAIVTDPFLYMVGPGRDVKEREYRFPYRGTIHAMGVHMHPYGRSFELINTSTGEQVWKAEGRIGADGKLFELPLYSSTEGYDFDTQDHFLLRAIYENPTDIEQDAMAGLFIFFSTPDGEGLGTLGFCEPKAREMSRAAGFTRFEKHDFENPVNDYYEIRIKRWRAEHDVPVAGDA